MEIGISYLRDQVCKAAGRAYMTAGRDVNDVNIDIDVRENGEDGAGGGGGLVG